MNLEHSNLPRFEDLLKSLFPLIFQTGIDELRTTKGLYDPSQLRGLLQQNPSALRTFIRECHYGWDMAQRKISRKVVEYEEQIRTSQENLKVHLRNRNCDEATKARIFISCLKTRQIVLRRLADVILYHLVRMKSWIPRHFSIEEKVHPIDPPVLLKTVEVATELNRYERLDFHLVSDLTTVVQIGDLVRLRTACKPPELDIVELKEGKLNLVLTQLIEGAGGQLDAELTERIRQQFGEKAVSQGKRIERQQFRMREFTNLVNTDHGIDPLHKLPMNLTADPIEVDDYGEALTAACSQALSTGVSVRIIGKCFRLVAVNADTYKTLGRLGIAHLLYHFQSGIKECALASGDAEELERAKHIFPFFDLVEMNLRSMWPPPIFLWPMDRERICDLLFRRLLY